MLMKYSQEKIILVLFIDTNSIYQYPNMHRIRGFPIRVKIIIFETFFSLQLAIPQLDT